MRTPTRLTILTAALLATLAGCSLFEESEEEGGALPPDMARRADGKTATAWPTSLPEADVKKRIVQLIPACILSGRHWSLSIWALFL